MRGRAGAELVSLAILRQRVGLRRGEGGLVTFSPSLVRTREREWRMGAKEKREAAASDRAALGGLLGDKKVMAQPPRLL